MKRFITLMLICLSFAVTACDDADQQPEKTDAPVPAAVTSGAENQPLVREDESLLKFDYTAPESVLEHPDVRQWMADDRHASLADYMKLAREQRDTRLSRDQPFYPFESEKHWTVTADTETIYSIVADVYVFQGGAHGNNSFEVLVFSRAENKFMLAPQMFKKPLDFIQYISPYYCTELNKLRLGKRGFAGDPNIEDAFTKCPAMGQFPIAPIEVKGKITGFNIYLRDNVAGPHADGTYTVHIDVDDVIKSMVRDPYISDF